MEATYKAEIKAPYGIEIRAGTQIADYASSLYKKLKREVEFEIRKGDLAADARSIMQITLMAMTCGTKVEVTALTNKNYTENYLKSLAEDLGKQLERTDFKGNSIEACLN
jgi:phosphotransferase system HPr-like phosphotransfer protein